MNGRMTDRQFLLAVLSDGKPHTLQEIILASVRERGHAFTVHSRCSDLRKLGYTIRNTALPGKRNSIYQLIRRPLEEASSPDPPLASSSGLESVALERGSAAGLGPLEQLTLDVPRGAYEVAA